MPTRPNLKPTTGYYTSVGIISSIINDPELTEFSDMRGPVTATTESIRAIGQQITGYAPKMEAFKRGLIGRIGMVRLQYMLFTNPWAFLKKGKLEMGETIQQIWLGLATVFPYNPLKSETRFPKMAETEMASAFHSVNFREVYKVTINDLELTEAFLSLEGMRDFIERVIGSIARSVQYDEFMMYKYLLAQLFLAGKIRVDTVAPITASTANDVVTQVAETTNLFQFPSSDYTMAGNENTTSIENLIVLESARANALIKVNSLATAFNIDEVRFQGQVVLFDSLAKFNFRRMAYLMDEDPSWEPFTQEQLDLLGTIDIICMDREFMQMYDSKDQAGTPFINGEGGYTNYPWHKWSVLSASPFHNIIAYSPTASAVTAITLSPGTVTSGKGTMVPFIADVTTTGFARADVVFSITTDVTSKSTFIGQDGVLRIGMDETVDEITVKAVSVADETKIATATVTVA